MKTRQWAVGSGCCLAVLMMGLPWAVAAPSLPITKPPVEPTAAPTGPTVDPTSASGQWFRVNDGLEVFRSHEFYDNVWTDGNPDQQAGGGVSSFLAIDGRVVDIQFDASSGNIIAFKVRATIRNDVPAITPPMWLSGTNRHNESLTWRQQYVGTLFDTLLSTEFAVADLDTLPNNFVDPYLDSTPKIIAENEDMLAWYCYSQEGPQGEPQGDYYIPTWKFGDIEYDPDDPNVVEVSRVLEFSVESPGLDAADPRFDAIMKSQEYGWDLFQNRTTSTKCSDWIEPLLPDFGIPYGGNQEEPPFRSSDVSVFHNIAPRYYVLDVWVNDETRGHVDVVPDWIAYPPGTTVELTAVPEPNHGFNKWVLFDPNYPGDANYATTDTANPIWITMNADREVEAKFSCGGSSTMMPMVLGLLALSVGVALRRRN